MISFEGFLLFLILKKRNGRDRNLTRNQLDHKHLCFQKPNSHRGGHELF